MSEYRIVCTTQVPAKVHPRDAKIVAVGTGTDPDRADARWTVFEVIAAMGRGDRFYTKGKASGLVARIVKYWCSICGDWHIRSEPDATLENNLDYLRACNWRT